MSLTNSLVEELSAWCARSDTLTDVRAKARGDFFGYDEPGTIKYMPQVGEINARERRFIGWFSFDYRLPDGRHPAELAAVDLVKSAGIEELVSVTKSIQNTRFILAIVTTVKPGKGVFLVLENEEFEVESRILSQVVYKDDALCAHILPIAHKKWLVCPGWLIWPVRLGPGIRSDLRKFQLDPLQLERFLQQRSSSQEGKPGVQYPQDSSLEEAVARMTEAAKGNGKEKLVLSIEEWQTLVLADMRSKDITRFGKDITKMVGGSSSLEDMNKWLALAMNIWNNVPQPDRGGKSANQMVAEEKQIHDYFNDNKSPDTDLGL